MKKLLSFLLILLLCVGMLFSFVSGEQEEAEHFVVLGSYEQDGNTENGPEPIEWIVLAQEDGRALLLSRYALDVVPFSDFSSGLTWEKCTLRAWLNGTFLNAAFTEADRGFLLSTSVPNNKEQGPPAYSLISQHDTVDVFFCLSYAETKAYIPDENMRRAEPSLYAIGKGAKCGDAEGQFTEWWIRSPDDTRQLAATCNGKGTFFFGRLHSAAGICVRPACQVDVSLIRDASAEPPSTLQVTDQSISAYLDSLTVEELQALKSEVDSRIGQNTEEPVQATPAQQERRAIKDLFPDKDFAKLVRDKLNKPSINAEVTQAELDSLTELKVRSPDAYRIQSLEGISNLRMLTSISLSSGRAWGLYGPSYRSFNVNQLIYVGSELTDEIAELKWLKYLYFDGINITKLPDSMRKMTGLQSLTIRNSTLCEVPDWIGELENLQTLNFMKTFIKALPDSIGSLRHLVSLTLTDTDIASLPNSICNLTSLRELRLNYTQLTELPDGIDRLQLTVLDISNTAIE